MDREFLFFIILESFYFLSFWRVFVWKAFVGEFLFEVCGWMHGWMESFYFYFIILESFCLKSFCWRVFVLVVMDVCFNGEFFIFILSFWRVFVRKAIVGEFLFEVCG